MSHTWHHVRGEAKDNRLDKHIWHTFNMRPVMTKQQAINDQVSLGFAALGGKASAKKDVEPEGCDWEYELAHTTLPDGTEVVESMVALEEEAWVTELVRMDEPGYWDFLPRDDDDEDDDAWTTYRQERETVFTRFGRPNKGLNRYIARVGEIEDLRGLMGDDIDPDGEHTPGDWMPSTLIDADICSNFVVEGPGSSGPNRPTRDDLRDKDGMTVVEMGKVLGLPSTFLRDWLRGGGEWVSTVHSKVATPVVADTLAHFGVPVACVPDNLSTPTPEWRMMRDLRIELNDTRREVTILQGELRKQRTALTFAQNALNTAAKAAAEMNEWASRNGCQHRHSKEIALLADGCKLMACADCGGRWDSHRRIYGCTNKAAV